jgi:ferrous iron transport protein B
LIADPTKSPSSTTLAGATLATREPVVVAIGNPNTGKSTLFNALTGLRQKVANYPGVTVERHVGRMQVGGRAVQLVDLPGTYSLAAQSPDEMVAVDVLLGQVAEVGAPDAALIVVDASNLRRNLYLASQVLDLGVPTVIALNMSDQAQAKGISIDAHELSVRLGATVVPVVASRKFGLDNLKQALAEVISTKWAQTPSGVLPEIKRSALELAHECSAKQLAIFPYEIERALIDGGGYAEQRLLAKCGDWIAERLSAIRHAIAGSQSLAGFETRKRYEWINGVVATVETRQAPRRRWSDRIDKVVSHPIAGTLLFLVLMGALFQSVFAWAQPAMDLLDEASVQIGTWVAEYLPPGPVASLITKGMIAGVGSVIVFLPQILLLSGFIILLEDTGYMARAAFLMDRLMRFCGLSGQSFIPMLSSFACAVPGIMATRVIPNYRDRLATILAAPFMTCSARLPIYALLISAFVPQQTYVQGWVNLQGLVLLGLYLLGIVGGVVTALLVKRTVLKGPTPALLMELPPYRFPNIKSVLIKLWERAHMFLVRAGTIIFTVSVLIWALAYFPHPSSIHEEYEAQRAALASSLSGDELASQRSERDKQEAAVYLEQSWLGRIGKVIEPAFWPLGWDWKVSAAVIASFPAREVVIAVLGTIYAVGEEVDENDAGLIKRIRDASRPDGTRVFSLWVAVGLMVFYAFCLQCGATVAVIRRETNSWRWAGFAWIYMTSLGYLGAWACVRWGAV